MFFLINLNNLLERICQTKNKNALGIVPKQQTFPKTFYNYLPNIKVTTTIAAINPMRSASNPTFKASPIFFIPTAPK